MSNNANPQPETSETHLPKNAIQGDQLDKVRAYAADPRAGVRLTAGMRLTNRERLRRSSDSMLENLCKVAEANGGVVVGIKVDSGALRRAMSDFGQAKLVRLVLQDVARRILDEALVAKTAAATPAIAAYRVMLAVADEPDGAAYRAVLSELKKGRRPKKKSGAPKPDPK